MNRPSVFRFGSCARRDILCAAPRPETGRWLPAILLETFSRDRIVRGMMTALTCSRGSALGPLQFASQEQADAAIAAMNEQELDGRQIRVNYANSQGRGAGGGGAGGGAPRGTPAVLSFRRLWSPIMSRRRVWLQWRRRRVRRRRRLRRRSRYAGLARLYTGFTRLTSHLSQAAMAGAVRVRTRVRGREQVEADESGLDQVATARTAAAEDTANKVSALHGVFAPSRRL